jgi:hypothetical protein
MNDNGSAAVGGLAVLFSGVFMLVMMAIIVFMIASMWKVFVKAGQPGWAAIVPIYNVIILLQITGKPLWWIVLCMIPLVNIVIMILICIDLAKCFGQSAGFGIGLALVGFVFFPILGFGSARYTAPAGIAGPSALRTAV